MTENRDEPEGRDVGGARAIRAQNWLRARLQKGNWLDIAHDEEIPPEITDWNRTLVHMHQVVFSPEIRRRFAAGTLPDDFLLWGAQLVQPHDGECIIRLNDEVRGVPYLRTGRAVQKGEQILLGDLEGLEYFDLQDDELDCGHFTIFWTGLRWVGAFDFRAGRAKCLSLIDKALRFLSAARIASDQNLSEPAIDALHTACELLAKSRLILGQYPAHKWKSHGPILSAINREGKLGNVDAAFLDLFNRLSDIRGHVRYAAGYVTQAPGQDQLDLVEAMALSLRDATRARRPDADEGG